jgi:hypothetical protein
MRFGAVEVSISNHFQKIDIDSPQFPLSLDGRGLG